MQTLKSVEINFASEKLYKALYDPAEYRVLKGGRSSTKSWGVADKLVDVSNSCYVFIVCAREVQDSIKDSSKKLIEDRIKFHGLIHLYHITNDTIIHKITGATFVFKGLKSDPEKIKSLEGAQVWWVEEAEKVSEASWDNLTATIRDEHAELILTFNPRFVTDATWIKFVENPPPNTIVEHFTYEDNAFFSSRSRSEMEHDKKTDEALYRYKWLGEPMAEEFNTLVTPKMIEDSQSRVPYETGEPKIAGFDVARYGKDLAEFVQREGNITTFDNSVKGLDTQELADWGKEQVIMCGCDILVVDSAGSAGVFDLLKTSLDGICVVYDFNGAYKSDNVKYYNQRVECWFKLRDWIRDTGKLPKTKKVEQLTQITYYYNNNNKIQLPTKEIMRRQGIHSPDWGDALSMTFYADIKRVVEKTRKRPRRRGFSG